MLRKLVQWKSELPGEEERARLVREVGLMETELKTRMFLKLLQYLKVLLDSVTLYSCHS